MFDAFMVYVADDLKTIASGAEKFASYRKTAVLLAHYHGYLSRDFSFKQSTKASVDLPNMLRTARTDLAKHVSKDPINQENAAFTDQEMKDFLPCLADMTCSADTANMLLYGGIAIQSLSRPGQLCNVRRKDISMYPNQEMHETADFGPIRMLGVSTVGFKQNEQAQVTHWIQRTRQPQLLDPVFAMAMKAALDAKEAWNGTAGSLLAIMENEATGEHMLHWLSAGMCCIIVTRTVHAASIVSGDRHDDLVREKVPLWKLQPLMSASGLWHKNRIDFCTNPFKHTTTPKLIDVMSKVLKAMKKDEQHIGRKTLLFREAGFVKLVLKGGELLTTPEHTPCRL